LELGRVSQAEYLEIERELVKYLEQKFRRDGKASYRIPRFYKSKPDFGDVDILLSDAVIEDWKVLQEEIAKDLAVTQYKTKGDLSMAYKDKIQVDVMVCKDECLDSTWQFLCYNDLGNLLGKHYRRFNLLYGEKGLFYVYRRESGGYRKDILLTRDMKKILGFLELSFEEWDSGFDTLEKMFDWVIACKYFTVTPFVELTTNTAKRAKLRTTMRKFVQYVQDNNIQKNYEFQPKDTYLPMIMEYFSDVPLADLIQHEKTQEEREKAIKSKFNANIIMKRFPDLKGPKLGKFIAYVKAQYDDFDATIVDMEPEAIETALDKYYEGFSV